MGFLDGLFTQTVPELPVADEVVAASASVDAGQMYRIAASDSDITLTMNPISVANAEGQRFAVKIYIAAPAPPGGALEVNAPAGQQIEADDGTMGAAVALADQALGTYREWLCDDDGNWLLVGGVS